MARDYTKYNVEGLGGNLNKRQLVYTVVKDWVNKNNPSFDAIQKAFPAEAQGSKGFIMKASEVKDAKIFNIQEPLSIKNGTQVVVSNQWGTKNIATFLELAEKLGYNATAVGSENNEAEVKEITPSSNLTVEQIAKFKKQEAEIEGDYKENSWEASSLYDDLLEAGDTAWADQILQKIAAAAEDFLDIEAVCDKLKERNENDRFLATAKKAEAMAKDTADMMSLAGLVSDTDKDWAIELYKKAEDKAESSSDILRIADEVKEIDKDWLIKLYQKAETLVRSYRNCVYFADKVKEFDKDLVIRLYQKAEQKADNSQDLKALADLVFPFVDKDWAIKLLEKATEKAEDFYDFLLIGDVYGKADGIADKDKAKTFFEKAIPLIDCQVYREQLLESAQKCLGNEDAFTKKIVQLIDNVDNVEIEISGRIPNYFFGAVREEYLEELQTALDCASEDIEEIGDVIKALFHTTLDNFFENHLETLKSNFDMEIIAEKCPKIMEIIQMVEDDEMGGHYRFYEWFLDDPSHDLEVIEDDAYITITVNEEIVVEKQELKKFLGETDFPDYKDAKTTAIVTALLDANKETYGIDYDVLEEDIGIGVSKNGVKQFHHWMEHENFKEFKSRKNNVTICHDNITVFNFGFETENFDLAKLIFLGYSNMADFRHSGREYVGSYLAYDSKVLDCDTDWIRDKGIELMYEPNFQSLKYLIDG